MNNKYTVITDNGGGPNQIYHDIAGEIYTFPPMYRNKLTSGTHVIYHRAKKKKEDENIPGRMSDESHYFGIAEIGELGKVRGFNYKGGTLKVLAQKPNIEGAPLSFLIRHEISSGITDIGFLDPIINGLRFTGKIDNQNIGVNIML